jgi:tetratricopeptide (TPR) repeat protein
LPDSRPTERCVNRSALLTSLMGLVVLTGAGYQWHQFSLARNTKTLYDYAESCAGKKDYPVAAAQFARYVQFRPNDAAARVRLAETYDLAYSNLGRTQRAIELYRQALEVAPEERKASIHGRLGELLLEARQYVAAADEAEAMLKHDPTSARAANLWAKALSGQACQGAFEGKPKGVAATKEARHFGPESPDSNYSHRQTANWSRN